MSCGTLCSGGLKEETFTGLDRPSPLVFENDVGFSSVEDFMVVFMDTLLFYSGHGGRYRITWLRSTKCFG